MRGSISLLLQIQDVPSQGTQHMVQSPGPQAHGCAREATFIQQTGRDRRGSGSPFVPARVRTKNLAMLLPLSVSW